MLTSMNLTVQLLRVAGLKGRLQEVSLTVPESSDVLTTACRTVTRGIPSSILASYALWSTRFGGDRWVSVFPQEQLADRLA